MALPIEGITCADLVWFEFSLKPGRRLERHEIEHCGYDNVATLVSTEQTESKLLRGPLPVGASRRLGRLHNVLHENCESAKIRIQLHSATLLLPRRQGKKVTGLWPDWV
jgi:hypothetical protein